MLYQSGNDGVLKRYLEDIRMTRPITRQEERELFRHLKHGSRAARERLISCNMRFVLKVALQYRGCPLPLTDLVNEGSMGLIRAIESYDESRGIKFISYAVWWIKAFITRAINETGSLIRLPANQHLRVRKALRECGDSESLPQDVKELIALGAQGSSFDQPLTPGSKNSLSEVLCDDQNRKIDDQTEIVRMEKLMQEWVSVLPTQESQVIQGIFGFEDGQPKTLREVGSRMGVSNERVRQLRDQALRRIRNMSPQLGLREKFEGFLSAVG